VKSAGPPFDVVDGRARLDLSVHQLMLLSVVGQLEEIVGGDGNLVGIDIDNASAKVDLHRLIVSRLPGDMQTIVG